MHSLFRVTVLRHSVLAIVFIVAASTYSYAQTNNPPTVGFGLKSGAQWPTGDGGTDHLGSDIGIFLDFNKHPNIGVTGDVLFVMTPESDEPGAPSGRLDYFQLPLMLRLRQGNGTFGVYGVAGPAFNLKVSGSDDFESQTVDFVFGGGVEIKNGMIEARLSRGSRDFVVGSATSSVTQKTIAVLVAFRLK